MNIITKAIWITAIVVVFLSLIWFLIGSTAYFNRGIDLVTTVKYVYIGIPALIFIIVSIVLLKKGWMPNNVLIQIGLVLVIIILSVIFTRALVSGVNTEGWLKEYVRSDYTQTTSDGKYEYKLQLINLFQKNSYAQLYIKDISTSEETIFPVDIKTREIDEIGEQDEDEEDEEEILFWRWSKLIPSDIETIYILSTTKELKDEIEKFEINLKEKTVRKIKKT